VILALHAGPCAGQATTQVWGELTLDWFRTHAFSLGIDIEPKVLVTKPEQDPGWATLDVTPKIEYKHGRWFDIVGELHLGRTRQTDQQDSTEVTPRVGFRFHVLSNLVDDLIKERRPKRRLVLRNLARVEWRNLYYSDETPQSSTVRIRDRIENLFPINRPRVTDDGAVYASADAEWFWPLEQPSERFANKQRVRAGLGYRRNYAWRLEFLYVWDRSRDSAEQGFTTSASGVDLRVRRVW
jgi:hypothetical protein